MRRSVCSAGVDAEAEDRAVQPALDHRLDEIAVRARRVKIDRHVERLAGFEDRPEFRIVEPFAIGVAVEDRALESELVHGTLDLLGRVCRILRREGRERGVARGIAPDRFGRFVIHRNRKRARVIGVQRIDAGRREQQELHVDAGRVHVGDAARPEIEQPVADEASAAPPRCEDRSPRGS